MDSNEIETLILRFRDLVTEPGGTINLHRAILQKRPLVSWGWWNKFGEKVPADVFQRLNGRAKEGPGLEVLLFDSGREQLYRAVCTQIRTAPDGARLASLVRANTPKYYRDQRYMAWFEFTSIDELPLADPESVLRDWTYERVDSFFDSGDSRYGAFYGKRVYSPAELRQQDRTIWFIRKSRVSDPSHEIRLADAKTVAPYHFPGRAIEADGNTFLWLSDLHLSSGHHNFPLKSTTSKLELAAALERDLQTMGVTQLAGVLLSGDLTWRASEDEFRLVREFVRGVQSWSKLNDYQFMLCPGNHDVRFSSDPGELDKEVTVAGSEARAEYEHLYKDLYNLAPNEFMSLGRRFLLSRAFSVDVASINSSLLDQVPGAFQGHGFVGDRQLNHVATQLGWLEDDEGPRPFRVVMLHHHVVPVTYREIPEQGRTYSVVLDAGALTRWAARFRVDLILHGHMHQPSAARLEVPLLTAGELRAWHTFHVIAMGSAGVAQKHLGEIQKNTFGLIRFEAGGVSVAVYTIDPVHARQKSDPPHFKLIVPYPSWA
jgi:Calcineurin-like phosphoesterase